MSHVTDLKLKVHDLDALAEACSALGLELQRDKKTYAWWGTFVGDSCNYGDLDPKTFGHGLHAIKIKGTNPKMGPSGPWEIGVVAAPDGDGLKLAYDAYGGAGRALSALVGENANRLRQEYAAAVASRKAKLKLAPKGFRLSREAVAGGNIRLRLRRS